MPNFDNFKAKEIFKFSKVLQCAFKYNQQEEQLDYHQNNISYRTGCAMY